MHSSMSVSKAATVCVLFRSRLTKRPPTAVVVRVASGFCIDNDTAVRRNAITHLLLSDLRPTLSVATISDPSSWKASNGRHKWYEGNNSPATCHQHYYHHYQRQQQSHSRRFFSTRSAFLTSDGPTSAHTNENGGSAASWNQMYDLLVDYHREHRSTIVPESCFENALHLSIGRWVKAQRKQSRKLSSEQKNLLNRLGFVWDHQEARWLEQYERLCDYESNLPVALTTENLSRIRSSDLESVFENRYQKDPVLRRWVNAQRQKYRRETISKERVRLLEKVDGFVWDVKEARWSEMHRRLSLFCEEHGTCIVPQHYSKDPQLACWVSNQRQRKNQLTAERIRMLDSLGFVWDVRELQWRENYEKYKALYFGEQVETDSPAEEQPLIDWAIKQRRSYKDGTLPAHRIKLLDDLVHPVDGSGFVWDPQGQNWMEMYEELREYRKIHKHVMVPTRSVRFDDDDDECKASSSSSSSSPTRQLGVWVANQRRNFKKGILSEERQKLLESIDFCWDAPEAMWHNQYQRLLDYRTNHIQAGGDLSASTLVPQHYPEDPQLAVWVKEQRQNRKHGILTAERLELLESIGFVWDASSPSSPP